MYLREKLCKVIKIINTLLAAFGLLSLVFSGYVILSLFAYYSDDIQTAIHARAMPDAVLGVVIGAILLVVSGIVRRLIGDAHFYSSYFENDLDGNVECRDLAAVAGKRESAVAAELSLFRRTIMKNFDLVPSSSGTHAVLKSKTYACQCRNCGAGIEKRAYFTGECAYCGSSDLFAKVLTDDRFYCISNDTSGERKPISYYTAKHISFKRTLHITVLLLAGLLLVILVPFAISCISNYNNEEYLRETLLSPDNHLYSFELIRKDLVDTFIFCLSVILMLLPVIFTRAVRIKRISTAQTCAAFFARAGSPFIRIKDLPAVDFSEDQRGKMKSIKDSLRSGYLLHCTFEKHDAELMVALAKKIVKDQCPSCGAPITGAADEHYRCRYCGRLIMEVIRRQ